MYSAGDYINRSVLSRGDKKPGMYSAGDNINRGVLRGEIINQGDNKNRGELCSGII